MPRSGTTARSGGVEPTSKDPRSRGADGVSTDHSWTVFSPSPTSRSVPAGLNWTTWGAGVSSWAVRRHWPASMEYTAVCAPVYSVAAAKVPEVFTARLEILDVVGNT